MRLYISYLTRRVLLMFLVSLAVTVLVFVVSNLIPGDPARLMAGPNAPAEVVQSIREDLGLNDPLYIRYFRFVTRLLHGNLGISIRTQRPVLKDLMSRFPATLELTLIALSLSFIGGTLLGVLTAVRQGSWLDHGARLFAISGVAMPSFWLGILLQLVFSFKLGLLPSSGRIGLSVAPPKSITGLYVFDSLVTGNWTALKSSLLHLVMPTVVLSWGTLALVSRTTRSSMLEVISLDYIRTARSKGCAEQVVIFKHALRNALIPVVTIGGMTLANFLGGTVLIETVFTWPGMGLYVVQSVFSMDFPAVMGFTILATFIVQVMNLLVDSLYAVLDPRIQYEQL